MLAASLSYCSDEQNEHSFTKTDWGDDDDIKSLRSQDSALTSHISYNCQFPQDVYFHCVITDHTPMLWSRLSARLWARLSWSGDTRSGPSLRMRGNSPRGHRDHRDIGSTFRDGLQDVVAIIKTEFASQIKLLLGIIGHRHQTASPSYCGPRRLMR